MCLLASLGFPTCRRRRSGGVYFWPSVIFDSFAIQQRFQVGSEGSSSRVATGFDGDILSPRRWKPPSTSVIPATILY